MGSLDSLPADQRAVIQLVLQRGRSYDDIASMLSIDRAAVRQRALDGFDALGPSHSIADPQRALLTDYLLGQLPPAVAAQVHERLAGSPPERAWLRVVASEITSLASSPLPEIPVASAAPAAAPGQADDAQTAPQPVRQAARQSAPVASGAAGSAATTPVRSAAQRESSSAPSRSRARDGGLAAGPVSSRRGGAIVLGLAGLVIAAIVLVIVLTSGGGSKPHTTASHTGGTPATSSTPAASTSPSTTSTTASKAKLLTQVNLVSPNGTKGTAGVAQVISEGSTIGVVIVAQGVPSNSKSNAYAVWLSNSSTDSKLVGFVNQKVGASGKLETEGPLPANASHYKQMLVTLETQGKPKAPGPIVLEGSLKLS